MLCGHLNGKKIKKKKRGDIRIHRADSLCCTAETNTTLLSNYTPIKTIKKEAKEAFTEYVCSRHQTRFFYRIQLLFYHGLPRWCQLQRTLLSMQNPPANASLQANAGDLRNSGSIPGLGRSPGGRNGNLLQYSCLENPHGQRSLAGYIPWGHKESDTTEATQHAAHYIIIAPQVGISILVLKDKECRAQNAHVP